MRNAFVAILSAFIEQAFIKELTAESTVKAKDWTDQFVDKLVDKLVGNLLGPDLEQQAVHCQDLDKLVSHCREILQESTEPIVTQSVPFWVGRRLRAKNQEEEKERGGRGREKKGERHTKKTRAEKFEETVRKEAERMQRSFPMSLTPAQKAANLDFIEETVRERLEAKSKEDTKPAKKGKWTEQIVSFSDSGTVRIFNHEKGFGYIKPDDGGEDIFYHISQVVSKKTQGVIWEGAKVSYVTEHNSATHKPQAIRVSLIEEGAAEKAATAYVKAPDLAHEEEPETTGIIQSWDKEKGIGWIRPDYERGQVYCHRTEFIGEANVTVGDLVAYTKQFDPNMGRYSASRVRKAEAEEGRQWWSTLHNDHKFLWHEKLDMMLSRAFKLDQMDMARLHKTGMLPGDPAGREVSGSA